MAGPTIGMIAADTSNTRSSWGAHHNMVAPKCSPSTSNFSGKVSSNLALGLSSYFLFWLKDYLLETYMLLAEERFTEHW